MRSASESPSAAAFAQPNRLPRNADATPAGRPGAAGPRAAGPAGPGGARVLGIGEIDGMGAVARTAPGASDADRVGGGGRRRTSSTLGLTIETGSPRVSASGN